MTKLFTPLRVGRVELSNRIAMAPMTRFRADDKYTPLPFVKEYYAQRASVPGTLLISEATSISARAGGYPNAPGIYNDAQIAAWKEVTDAVHTKGSYIYLQLWALGRVASRELLQAEGGFDLISSSATALNAESPTPRALSESEILEWIADYAQAARNAVAAGFDGVEIHAANGYLIDQFIQDTCNRREDAWGGGVEGRARFAVEVSRAVADAVGADRTGIRFSPWGTFQGMRMEDPKPQFEYLATQTAQLGLAYVHLVESGIAENATVGPDDQLEFFLRAYGKASPVIVAGGYEAETAVRAVDEKYADYDAIVGIGRPWISNPDLPFRIQKGIPFVPYDSGTFYVPKEPKGYIDYAFSAEFQKSIEAAA
ncbi:NADH:flavin oxidoreductase/NADH oxidase family protein [Penicillium digitatum]|uniref:chanoclavine-I aldehyde reductase n=3 Tax=Penicillium digitatum TaxID=36651 RepID=K9G8S6_PEND2|nr:NADH:flavin oxidoreductase/NADH oxidase family protein [Penicillium digitatum Pd1]EKV08070.1 NADH:flavin oxidoreductase/NADH oxidase family protein [Penicillium digitatum Pd1]EKV09666.1 NADH:flavin oxidoreductase/NADH oxidase family protein [Penicillium digitatum PHI26]QQK41545.1 NADH:flavin oxidoreductase/NADH oxidase family protein [Penicillium digitatum]